MLESLCSDAPALSDDDIITIVDDALFKDVCTQTETVRQSDRSHQVSMKAPKVYFAVNPE